MSDGGVKEATWRDYVDEIEHYNNLSEKEIKEVVQSGINTEFWKWFRSRIALLLQVSEASILRGETLTLDTMVRLAGLSATHKQLDALFHTPERVLKYRSQATQPAPTTPQSAKIGRQ